MPRKYLYNNYLNNSNNNSNKNSSTINSLFKMSKSKLSNKNKKNLKNSTTTTKTKKKQKGGMAPCSLKPSSVSHYVDNSCHVANVHNTEPTANYDFISGKGALPQSGGAIRDGTVIQNLPVQKMIGGKSNKKSKSQQKGGNFNDYLKKVAEKMGGSADNFGLDNTSIERGLSQVGAGYSVGVEDMIAGQPVYNKYDECCSPVLNRGKLVSSSSHTPVCGGTKMFGGGSKNKKNRTKRKSLNKKNCKNTKKRNKTNNSNTNNNNNNNSGKNRNKNKKKRKEQKGGSIPGKYPNSLNTPNSDFSNAVNPDLKWDCNQVYNSPKCR